MAPAVTKAAPEASQSSPWGFKRFKANQVPRRIANSGGAVLRMSILVWAPCKNKEYPVAPTRKNRNTSNPACNIWVQVKASSAPANKHICTGKNRAKRPAAPATGRLYTKTSAVR